MKKVFVLLFFPLLVSIFPSLAYSDIPPQSQAGSLQKQEEQLQEMRKLEAQIKSKKEKPEEVVVTEKPAPVDEGSKSLVKKIDVKGVTLIPKDAVDKIVKGYEGKELGLNSMQRICDLITAEYRKRGKVTSRAYLPPQTISAKEGILVIIVIEGKLGKVSVKGNRFFSDSLIKKKLDMKPGEYFDYYALQKALVKINEHPDRFVQAGLVPGKEPGTTDIVLEVRDRVPVHFGYELDNFNPKYMNYWRNSYSVEDNNLLGLDDKLLFKYQQGLDSLYSSPYFSYTVPLTRRLEAGVYWVWSDTYLAKQYKPLDIKGKSSIGGAFLNYTLLDMNNVTLKLTGGFDYKHVLNYTGGVKTSRDDDKVLKVGANLDVSDKFGRTIATLEEDTGLLWGDVHAKDPSATRPGAGGRFEKLTGNLYRFQPMPLSSSILWKNSFQYTNYNLLSVEQLQLGGVSNVRGFASDTYSADQGLCSTAEWSFPPYFFPKNVKVPFLKTTFYEATKFVAFYDMGYGRLHDPMGTDKPERTLQGWGYGLRFNLPQGLFMSIEAAYHISEGNGGDPNLYMDFGVHF